MSSIGYNLALWKKEELIQLSVWLMMLYNIITSKDPLFTHVHKIAPGRRKIVEDEILKMEKEGAITKSTGPWCSPIVLVRKKDGTIRFCVDYHKLKDVTHKDAYPLPRINDILDALRGAKYFCSIGLASGYWQIKVADKDREKIAFGSHLGLYEFLCMPFGLTGVPATFSRLMDRALEVPSLFGRSYHLC